MHPDIDIQERVQTLDSARLAQHIQKLRGEGHKQLNMIQIHTPDDVYEAVWIPSARPSRLDISMGGMIYQIDGRTIEEAVESWADDYNIVDRRASKTASRRLKEAHRTIQSVLKDLERHIA